MVREERDFDCKHEIKLLDGLKLFPAFDSHKLDIAVTVRESDKCHFHRRSAVSEDQGASCSALMRLLLRRTQRKGKHTETFRGRKESRC